MSFSQLRSPRFNNSLDVPAPTGTLHTQNLNATFSDSGSLIKTANKSLAASYLTTGNILSRSINIALAATYSVSGNLTRFITRTLTASFSATGNLAKTTARALVAATYSTAGILTSMLNHGGTLHTMSLSATFSTSGTLAKSTGKIFPATFATYNAYKGAILNSQPQQYLRLGDGSGTVAVDSINSANNGTYGGTVAWTNGILTNDPEKTTVFDGSTTFVTSPITPNLGAFSIEIIYNPATFVASNRVLDWQDSGPVNGFSLVQSGAGGNQLQIVIRNAVASITAATGTLALGTTYHIMCTYDGAHANIYVNGVLIQTSASTLAMTTATQTLTIGRRSAASSNFFAGSLQDFSIYNYALSATQVTNHYKASVGGGFLTRFVTYPLTATFSTAGSLSKSLARTLTGTFKTSGVLTSSHQHFLTLIATFKITGSVTARSISRTFNSTYRANGTLTRYITRTLGGTFQTSGNLALQIAKVFTATFRASGLLAAVKGLAKIITTPPIYLRQSQDDISLTQDDSAVELKGNDDDIYLR